MRTKQEASMAREPDFFIHPAYAVRPVQPFQPDDVAPMPLIKRIRVALLRLRAEGRHGHR